MQPKWSTRPYWDGDEEGILELHKAVHPERDYDHEKWLRWWNWFHRENPAGKAIMWLAEDNGTVVGYIGLVPIVIKMGSENVTGFQAINAMTHPDYRHQRVYQTISRKQKAEAATEGIFIIYSFPHENMHPILLRNLGWFDVSTRETLVKPLNLGNTLKLKIRNRFLLKLGTIGGNILQKTLYRGKKVPLLEGLTISRVPCFDERINQFWFKVSNQYQIMVVRNKDYLNWRYVTVPDVHYSIFVAQKAGDICGYSVLRSTYHERVMVGVIFDILAQSPDIAQCLLAESVAYFQKEKVDLIYCMMIANKTLVNSFSKNGFISVPFAKGGWFCAYSNAPEISKEFLAEPKNWFVQIGDSDML